MMAQQDKKASFIQLLIVASTVFHSVASHAMDVSAVGAYNLSIPNISSLGSAGSSSGSTFGGGLLVGFSLAPQIALEIGGLYLPRKYAPAGGIFQTEQRLHVPVVCRLDLEVMHVYAGGYYSLALGDLDMGSGTTTTYAASNQNTSDFGLIAGLGKVFEITPKVGFLVRGQFLFGLANASTNPLTTLNYRDIQGLLGINLSLW